LIKPSARLAEIFYHLQKRLPVEKRGPEAGSKWSVVIASLMFLGPGLRLEDVAISRVQGQYFAMSNNADELDTDSRVASFRKEYRAAE
jgi:hypothetical protein